ncbi:MAG TPA: hypothetical protein PLW70_02660 [Bacteroidales bacterium]|nr:hypothetical protein [Bacteroidales bacterium]HPX59644.1 hypothetical protein [Bacteroidales bacterium]HQB19493.1 hypothetical protein [Bacteroidales bacterium]
MKKYFLVILLLTLLLAACMPMLTVFFGISKPKEVTMKKIEKKISKYGLDYFKHYYITEEGFFSYFDILNKNNLSTSVTRVLVFKEGKLLQPTEINGCSSQRDGFIRTLQDSTSYISIDTVLLSDFVNSTNLSNFDINEYQQMNAGKDFTIVLYWASFSGVLNKNITAQLAQTTKDCIDKKGLNAHVFYINLDVKEGWSDRIKKIMKKRNKKIIFAK